MVGKEINLFLQLKVTYLTKHYLTQKFNNSNSNAYNSRK